MPRLLFIEASPRGDASSSTRIAAELADQLMADDPSIAMDRLHLWSTHLPDLSGETLSAKYARLQRRSLSDAEEKAWSVIGTLVDRLASADKVIISTPMWNFGIPYRLKHWIDLVTQPGLSFSFDPATGYSPLLAARPVYVVLASSGDYARGESRGRPDLATPYLKAALGFVGLTGARFIPVGPTAGSEADIAAGLERARHRILSLIEETSR